jgi:hypothetical protein
MVFRHRGVPATMAFGISIFNPRPSQIRWMESNITDDAVRDEYFEKLFRMLIANKARDVELVDDVWSSGIQSRNIFDGLTESQQDAIEQLNTRSSIVWMNGVHGQEWNVGL